MERALAVLDGVVLVVSAVEGVQAHTRVLIKVLLRLGLPFLIFVNKIDRAGARDRALLDELERLVPGPALAMTEVTGLGTPTPRSRCRRWAAERLAEAVAGVDDQLLDDYVAGRWPPRPGRLPRRLRTWSGREWSIRSSRRRLDGTGVEELITGLRLLTPDPAPASGRDPSRSGRRCSRSPASRVSVPSMPGSIRASSGRDSGSPGCAGPRTARSIMIGN